ncbi:hypothetical protein TOPH_05499 [Tolypocladium ophioglossoides CBS 100239]|uniref:Uncharacterized protein n=1 Tax=Tolypocladium ophioglossoides (strain CBS 100239) TaxID=1163406 RepID=A0A0L0N6N5_TOLOC|nr:hypothetical protein TOPH_05499 [Tolypocladium ophioglossoides CBS 100239]
MSGNSHAGAEENAERFEEGQQNSHLLNDPMVDVDLAAEDQRSIANRLAAEEHQFEPADDKETAMGKKDPTLPAKMHGNEPSRGAKIDAQLQAEEEEELRQKGKA